MPSTPHQTHDTVNLRDYLGQVTKKNRDFQKLCGLVSEKYDRHPKNVQKIRQAIRAKEDQLGEVLDQRITQAIARLKGFQIEVKRRFHQMLLQNVEQIEKAQDSLVRKCRRGRTLSKGLEAAADIGRIDEIVRAAKNIDKGFVEMND
jgi:hypothetical protein